MGHFAGLRSRYLASGHCLCPDAESLTVLIQPGRVQTQRQHSRYKRDEKISSRCHVNRIACMRGIWA